MKNLFKFMFVCLLFVACSSNDDSPGAPGEPIDPGGNDDDDEVIENNAGNPDAVAIEGFTYIPTDLPLEIVDYPIGNIVSPQKLASSTADNLLFKDILLAEYNSITAENDMKPSNMFLGPNEEDYDYSDGDAIVAYAKANNLRVHGHVLVWHSQQPAWFSSFAGTDEEFEDAILNYVTNTVAHFAEEKLPSGESVVASWDVVNEVFEDPDNVIYTRTSDDFVAKCFIAARAGDPDVKLFYNDFNIAGDETKRNKILAMVEDFQTRDTPIPIDGIGMQMHLNHDWPSTDLPTAITDIANTGLLVHASELDVKANYNDDVTELNSIRASEQEHQYQRAAYYYETLVPDNQKFGITLWGFRDQDSWLYDGGDDWPAVYDNEFNYKISHRGLVNGLKGQNPE